ncbi:uncharacterized protein M421DRAFT_103286 [Didymella exigua CBS 183.55]|uniref:Rhodopsin domain-containing protein n=1 Tax=Didymella exigua CBS 183.55 TaxID=1150837 RepID=A0A6A5RCW6_9PLEO|nr:uncharacterized protein M421DRAFT_103286 [Didymella exigua CBS 183.55]KAF1925229.1 hypothetical protein M421DRAFT_103286 [Didymella exigua CBS 183.55]
MTTIYVSSHHPIPRQPGSRDDLGPFLNVVTWILLITSALAVVTRLITKRALKRRVDVDDAFVLLALITSIGSGASVSVQVANGLGRDLSTLVGEDVEAYLKAEYANKILYIATLALAKLSIISLLMNITASDRHRHLGLGLTGFIALWGLVSVIATSFQCGGTYPWRTSSREGQCIDFIAFWQGMSVINMLTDLALILFPVHVIVTLQMSMAKKVTILTFFGARLLDIVATAVQMAYIDGFSSTNPTRDLWKWTLVTQIIECITILTSCVPYLRPLLESIPSGLYGSDEIRRRGTPSEVGYSRRKGGSYQLSSTDSKTDGASPRSGSQNRKSRNDSGMKRFLPMLLQDRTTHSNSASGVPGGPRRLDGRIDVEITATRDKSEKEKKWETDSIGSNSKILKTTVVSAEWEEAQRQSREASVDEIKVLR